MKGWDRATIHRAASWLLVAILGGFEGIYGRSQYTGDAICYLNVSRAVARADWKLAFDPMWTLGYPSLVAAMGTIFPGTAEGEWHAITLLNWLIFLAGYGTLLWLVAECAARILDPLAKARAEARRPLVTWSVCALFLGYSLCFHSNVSLVTPDLLVATLLVTCAAQTLRTLRRPAVSEAIALGVLLGVGCWTKGVFLSYSAIIALVLAIAVFTEGLSRRVAIVSVGTCGLIASAYVAAISWAYGQFTMGVTGELNYAFHVNHLPHWTHWLGGPPEFGAPIHHSEPLVEGLPAFVFPSSFTSTYPPYNNMWYWYRGYRRFTTIHNQAMALAHTGYVLVVRIVLAHPLMIGLVVVAGAIAAFAPWRAAAWPVLRRLWPLSVLSVLVVATYLLVHIEDRYLSVPFLLLSLLPLGLLADERLPHRRVYAVGLAMIYVLTSAREVRTHTGWTISAAWRGQDFHTDRHWRLAAALAAHGIEPGDAVAVITDDEPASRCTWAYIAHLRIVAEFGSAPWRIAPFDRVAFDGDEGEAADANPAEMFWRLTGDQRAQILDGFRRVGARVAVAFFRPDKTPAPGWVQVEGTGVWMHLFDRLPASG